MYWENREKEREGRQRPWTNFPAWCCSRNALFHWFRRHNCVSGVRQLFDAHLIMVLVIFVCLYIISDKCSFLIFTSSRLLANRLSNRSHPLTSACCVWGGNVSFSSCSSPAQKIWNPQFFFLVILITEDCNWLTYNNFFSLTHPGVNWPFVECLLFLIYEYILSNLNFYVVQLRFRCKVFWRDRISLWVYILAIPTLSSDK